MQAFGVTRRAVVDGRGHSGDNLRRKADAETPRVRTDGQATWEEICIRLSSSRGRQEVLRALVEGKLGS